MSPAVLAACLLAGVATWALRVVPLLLARRRSEDAGERPGPLRAYVDGFLSAMAVSSVAALLVSGVEPYLLRAAGAVSSGATGAALREVAALAAGLGATAGAYLWRRDVALGTVGGAAAYGLAAWLLGA